MNTGYIKIGRNITQNWVWNDPVKLKWWLDLLLMAAYEKTTVKVGNNIVDCERGQIITTLSELAKRWGVSRDKVRHFLTSCTTRAQIAHSSRTDFTQITICNYDSYQDTPHTFRTDCAQIAHSTLLNTINKENNIISNNIIKEKNDCSFSATSDDVPALIKPYSPKIHFSKIIAMWNDICTDYPKLIKLSDTRKNKIRNRIKEMGGEKKAEPILRQIFTNLQNSAFLKGDNKRGWRANFDWVFANDENWVKVLENNYDKTRKTNERVENNRASNANKTAREQNFADYIARKLYGNSGAQGVPDA